MTLMMFSISHSSVRHFPERSWAVVAFRCFTVVIEVFDDSDKVGADVVLLHGCPQSCMPNPVEGLLKVYEYMVQVFLVLKIFLAEDL